MNALPSTGPQAPQPERFPLPQRHRRFLACAAVAASVALGSLGVAATVETVGQSNTVGQNNTVAVGAAAR